MKIQLNYAIFCCAIFALSFLSGMALQAAKARRTTVQVETTILRGFARPANVVAAPNLSPEPASESRVETFVVEETASVQAEDVATPDISFDSNGDSGSDSKSAGSDADAERKAGERRTIRFLGNDYDYAFRWIPPGSFFEGSPNNEEGRFSYETRRRVTLTRGFWLLETETTQEMWENFGFSRERQSAQTGFPVEGVDWEDCQQFLARLNAVAPPGWSFRLPTEAEWEYACRAGTTTPFYFGDVFDEKLANCNNLEPYGTTVKGSSLASARPVGSYPANAWGLRDMHGNVAEWCSDWFDAYSPGNAADPKGPENGTYRVARGGSWRDYPRTARSASRLRENPLSGMAGIGFRIVAIERRRQL